MPGFVLEAKQIKPGAIVVSIGLKHSWIEVKGGNSYAKVSYPVMDCMPTSSSSAKDKKLHSLTAMDEKYSTD